MSAISKLAAVDERIRSWPPPSASRTVRRDRPKPTLASRCAMAAGASASAVKASTRRPRWSSGRMSSIERPCNETVSISCIAQPSRDAARLNADGAGITRISSDGTCRASVAPTPKKNGSPDASTQTGAPRNARTADMLLSNGIGQGFALPVISSRASSRCRAPPNTLTAAAIACLASEPSPAMPSSPMPTTESHFCSGELLRSRSSQQAGWFW